MHIHYLVIVFLRVYRAVTRGAATTGLELFWHPRLASFSLPSWSE